MCGIAGLVWRDTSRPAGEADVAAMCDALAHRGPDGAGGYADGPVALGHRRLAILDLSPAGRQPMTSEGGALVLTYNGEIYNYLELRAALEALGRRFRSDTDTEVILEAYRAWGPDCVTRFNGMWAFALYDRPAGKLLLSRDRFGIKPLYYALDGEAFAFASEIKALLVARPRLRRARRNVLARFLPGGVFDDGAETFFEGVEALRPAQSAWYDVRAGGLTAWSYWRVEREAFAERWRSRDPIAALAGLLDSAVRLHLRSDVPVGSCLSGGVDSSALVCLMSRHHRQPVRTFSGLYADPGCDESAYAEAVNRHVPTVPFPVRPEPRGDLVEDLARLTWHQDGPTAGPGLYTQYHVMRRAAPEVTVLLDGQGSDELFAGYLFYLPALLDDLLRRPTPGNRLRAARLVAGAHRHWPGTLPDGWKALGWPRLHALAAWVNARRLPARPAPYVDPVHPALAASLAAEPIVRAPLPGLGSALEDLMHDQLTRTSIPALLHYEDRNSMAFSVEARVPFLDHRVVEFALALDPRWKVRGSWTKWVLRKAAEPVLPRQVAWRRSKLGYPTPMARWFRQDPDRGHVQELLFSRELRQRELVAPDALERLWREHQAGADYSWVLYRVLTTELWHRHFLDALVPCPAAPVRRPAPPAAGRAA